MWYLFWYWPAIKCIHSCTYSDKFWLLTFQCIGHFALWNWRAQRAFVKNTEMQPSSTFQTPSALEGWLYSIEIVLLNYKHVSLSRCQIVESFSNRSPVLIIGINISWCHVLMRTKEKWMEAKGEQTSSCSVYGKKENHLITASLPDGCLRCGQE